MPSFEKSLNGSMMGDMSKRLEVHGLTMSSVTTSWDDTPRYIFPWGKGLLNIWVASDNPSAGILTMICGGIYHLRYTKEYGYVSGAAICSPYAGGTSNPWQESGAAGRGPIVRFDLIEFRWTLEHHYLFQPVNPDWIVYEYSFIFDYTDW